MEKTLDEVEQQVMENNGWSSLRAEVRPALLTHLTGRVVADVKEAL